MKNSQKRIYLNSAVYFITTNTNKLYAHFNNDIFCKILQDDIKFSSKLKSFNLFAYKINPDHIHILLQPGDKYNISQIIANIKRTSSLHINQVIHTDYSPGQGGNIYSRLQWNGELIKYREEFKRSGVTNIPKFKWQGSYHDHIIRNPTDFTNHINYINNQHIKHSLPENKFCYIDEELCNLYISGF